MSGHSAACPARGGPWKDCRNPMCGGAGHAALTLHPCLPPIPGQRPVSCHNWIFFELPPPPVHELLYPQHIWVCWRAQFLSVIQWLECGVANWDCKYNVLKSPGTLGEEISDFGFLRLPGGLLRRLVHTLREHSSLPYIVPLKSPKLSLWC